MARPTQRKANQKRLPAAGSDSLELKLLRLLEVALSAGAPGAERYARTLLKSASDENPELAEAIASRLHAAPQSASPFKSDTIAAIPVDGDTRMKLVKVEHPVVLEREPILAGALKFELAQIVEERRRMADLRRVGASPTRSALFEGPPGVGKTLSARWLARELGVPLLVLDLASVMSSFLGRTGVNIRNVLDYARGIKCVLLLDELDAIAKRRDDLTEIGELKRLVTVLLQEVDSWPETGLLIASTNHPELLDRAVWRRFDAVLHFDVPTHTLLEVAISDLLPDLAPSDKYFNVIRTVYSGKGISDLERDMRRLRRQSVLGDVGIPDLIKPFMTARIRGESHATRLELARKLIPAGLSQREVHDLTGVSRDTLRRARI